MSEKIYRTIAKTHIAKPTSDGAGVKLMRAVTHGDLSTFDPFLMLDEFHSENADDYIAGFPDHPHRGFQTVTYMLKGKMRHKDHLGNEGVLHPNSIQWMTAGRGIIHSEMPEQIEGEMHGFQLWINLPAKDKMCEPSYQEFDGDAIQRTPIGSEGSSVNIIAGSLNLMESTQGEETSLNNMVGPIQGLSTEPEYFDFNFMANQSLTIKTDPHKHVMLYVYKGEVSIVDETGSSTLLKSQQMAQLTFDEILKLRAGETETKFLFLAGLPLNEPVAHWGPFVMNTREEVEQAMRDYRDGRLISA